MDEPDRHLCEYGKFVPLDSDLELGINGALSSKLCQVFH